MRPTLRTVRAIAAELLRRYLRKVFLLFLSVITISIGLSVWLVNINKWWWLLLAVVITLSCAALLLLIVIRVLINLSAPRQNPDQQTAVAEFSNKLKLMADTAGDPKLILLFKLARDVLKPHQSGFIGTITRTSQSLKNEFNNLVALFE